jgi:putative thioredoxin
MVIDVTDATFQTEVVDRSATTPVVIDLWATWCGPCQTLGPILERVVAETDGAVVLAKVDVDQNPAIAQAFRAQSIPAVFAMSGGQVVDGFIGAQPEHMVREFVARLGPDPAREVLTQMIATGDTDGLRALLVNDPANEAAIIGLAELLVRDGETDEAMALLARIPESDQTRRIAAMARLQTDPGDDHDAVLTALLDRVATDDEARQQFLDILELMGPDDPRTANYRRQLTARLF